MNPQQNRLRGRIGASVRHRPDDQETADHLRRELKASLAEDYIRALVSDPPCPTTEQRVKLASILVGPDGGEQ
jgi:hypothetical protein